MMGEAPILKQPWTHISHGLPPVGLLAVWMDVDGCNHLARLEDGYVLPNVYDQVEVHRQLGWHVCWRPVPEGTISTSKALPEDGQEALWLDDEGVATLGTRRGKMVSVAVYGPAKDISLPISNFNSWVAIDEPQVEGDDQSAVER